MNKIKIKLWVLNAVVCIICAVVGVASIVRGNVAIGVVDLMLSVLNGVIASRGFTKR